MSGCETVTSESNASGKDFADTLTQNDAKERADPAVIFANANRKGEPAYKEGYFGSGDSRLHYVEVGEGPLIILYHGFPSFWYSWFDQMEALKGSYRVVAVDALGSGLSAKPQEPEPYRIAALAAQLDDFSRHLGGDDKYVLAGHDWGSVLALSYAQAYPHRLHKVIGMSAPPLNVFLDFVSGNPEQQRRNQYMQDIRQTTLEQLRTSDAGKRVGQSSYQNLARRGDLTQGEVKLFHTALAEADTINSAMNWYRANVPSFDAVTDSDLWPGPDHKIMVPALFIWGDEDQIFLPELIDLIGEAGPDVKVVRLPGINHWTTMEQPERANQAIISFLDK
ncbi:alpha/beta hydrolase [Parasphingorhabdus sp.]|uniref:alpha/beta fold hydrolase n=2 Tax=Parasphingorhabdus sp. TaxID=2709688 RepID=UPI003264E6C8